MNFKLADDYIVTKFGNTSNFESTDGNPMTT